MPDISEIKARATTLLSDLDALSKKSDSLCSASLTAKVESYHDLEELEEIRTRTEELRHQLEGIKHKGKLDPEVMETERNLDEALSRYYWLWQKCKSNMPEAEDTPQ